MYAVIDCGGHQYRVSQGEIVRMQRLEGDVGQEVTFSRVVAVGQGEGLKVSPGDLAGTQVKGVIVEQDRARKIIVFKKKKRKGYRRKNGHRQPFTAVRITEIIPS
ncbi:MAG: 50S ribosomal protein L21 [Candidatus Tectomicrobia bacterium]|nr:50S ribosomal protein L21 [Candidatus Tectomicrobia bacterium]